MSAGIPIIAISLNKNCPFLIEATEPAKVANSLAKEALAIVIFTCWSPSRPAKQASSKEGEYFYCFDETTYLSKALYFSGVANKAAASEITASSYNEAAVFPFW